MKEIFFCSLLCLFCAACRKDKTDESGTISTSTNTSPFTIPDKYYSKAMTLEHEPGWQLTVGYYQHYIVFGIEITVDKMPDSLTFRKNVLKSFAKKASWTIFREENQQYLDHPLYSPFPFIMFWFMVDFYDRNGNYLGTINFYYDLTDTDFFN